MTGLGLRTKSALLATLASGVALIGLAGVQPVPAQAAGTAAWALHIVSEPTRFSASHTLACEAGVHPKCDSYALVVHNVGGAASSGTVTVTDTLPAGLTTTGGTAEGQVPEGEGGERHSGWSCNGTGETITEVTCSRTTPVAAGNYASVIFIPVIVSSAVVGPVSDAATISGGGAAGAGTAQQSTVISGEAPPFEITAFDFAPTGAGGQADLQPGGHPYELTANFDLSTIPASPEERLGNEPGSPPVEEVKNIVVELPFGLVGDPLAAPRCSEDDLVEDTNGASRCPAASRVAAIAFDGAGSWKTSGEDMSYVYNMIPEHGYPAEFGFDFLGKPVYMYASVVHTAAGYRLRIDVPGVPEVVNVAGVSIAFFGDPAAADETGGAETAFLTNPTNCSLTGADAEAQVEADSWEDPGRWVSASQPVYPQLQSSGCDALAFDPSLELTPDALAGEATPVAGATTQAGQPSGYGVNLEVPQTSLFGETATANLDDVTVSLPQGVAVSPSAASGLTGCKVEGPEGINIGSGDLGHEGQDLDDPEATELGADGLYHTAAGHCPESSSIGTVEIATPLLSEPLTGRVFLAQPNCDPCTGADAEGTAGQEMLGLYLEAAGSGVIVKLKGSVKANATTGQLTASFNENPQLPFNDVKLRFKSGPRAALANPQVCGTYTTASAFTSWAGSEAGSQSPFGVSFNASGEDCPGTLPFSPSFTAGSESLAAGGYTNFSLTFARPAPAHEAEERSEQNLSGIAVSLPPGLLGDVSHVAECPEAQANAGTCPAASEIGTSTVLAGPGSEPYTITGGQVFFTGPYKGEPFGLSIVVPTTAGPFTLAGNTGRGSEVVRASIAVNPVTAALTVTSDPLPHVLEGVPLRLHSINVQINHPQFMFNPTSCTRQAITATITGEPLRAGEAPASAGVSSPFEAGGCQSLAFKPTFTATTQEAASFNENGASLNVKIASPTGQANIHEVKVTLPELLPSRLTTIQQACGEKVFASNPAACPSASDVGTAVADTPVLPVPLTGPAYLVSHGGAAFPNLEVILQGDGVTIDLSGAIDIKGKITTSTFSTIPDAPISSFELNLPEGPNSALAFGIVNHKDNLCGRELVMPTLMIGQNGAQIEQNTQIAVTGCGAPALRVVSHKVDDKTKTATILVSVPTAGKITATGTDLSKGSKTPAEPKTVTLKPKLTKKGSAYLKSHPKKSLKIKVKLIFTPKSGKTLTKTVAVTFGHQAKTKVKKGKKKKKGAHTKKK